MIRKVGKKKYGMAANHNNSDIDHNLRFIFDCQMGGKRSHYLKILSLILGGSETFDSPKTGQKPIRPKTAVSESAAGSRVRCSRNDRYDAFPVAAGIASVNR